jgi:hypothetical protein
VHAAYSGRFCAISQSHRFFDHFFLRTAVSSSDDPASSSVALSSAPIPAVAAEEAAFWLRVERRAASCSVCGLKNQCSELVCV